MQTSSLTLTLPELMDRVKTDPGTRNALQNLVMRTVGKWVPDHPECECEFKTVPLTLRKVEGRWTLRSGLGGAIEILATGMHGEVTVGWVRADGRLFSWDQRHSLMTLKYEVPEWMKGPRQRPYSRNGRGELDDEKAGLFMYCLSVLNRSWREVAFLLGIEGKHGVRTLRYWAVGERHIPEDIWPKMLAIMEQRNSKNAPRVAKLIREKIFGGNSSVAEAEQVALMDRSPPVKRERILGREMDLLTEYTMKRLKALHMAKNWSVHRPHPIFTAGRVEAQLEAIKRNGGEEGIVDRFAVIDEAKVAAVEAEWSASDARMGYRSEAPEAAAHDTSATRVARVDPVSVDGARDAGFEVSDEEFAQLQEEMEEERRGETKSPARFFPKGSPGQG